MPYSIIWSDSAVRALRKLDRTLAKRVFESVGELSSNPHRQLRRLAGSPHYRLRVGDFRVIVGVEESRLEILVIKVGHRESVYRP
ncbi:MAG TPA: type II toxin-antitoxin system RelE/ParE family toxin [Thermoplasmata archaeon]|nr:type II toxin-antitoxin system RelE/ParE family toxin [Thermoplasmata archaeon]